MCIEFSCVAVIKIPSLFWADACGLSKTYDQVCARALFRIICLYNSGYFLHQDEMVLYLWDVVRSLVIDRLAFAGCDWQTAL